MAVLVDPEFAAFHHKVAAQTSPPFQILCHAVIGSVPPEPDNIAHKIQALY